MRDTWWKTVLGPLAAAGLLLAVAAPAVGPAGQAAAASSGGTIVDGLYEEPGNLNPILGPDMTYSQIVDTAIFRNLFMITPNGTMEPDLASVVPSVQNGGISKNGLSYTFHLKQNADWSNGQPVTCQDIYETWKVVTNPSVLAVTRLGWDDVTNVKTISPKVCEVDLKAPFPAILIDDFSGNLPGIIPYSVFNGMTAQQINTASFNHDPTVTDGPYMFQSWVPGASITVVANPHWYGPTPKEGTIVFKVIPDENSLLANAQAHQINTYYFAPIEQVQQLKAIPGAHVFFTPMAAWESADINFRNPALQDRNVRVALEMAIDRQAILKKIWLGYGVLSAADQPSIIWANNPKLKPYSYDPAESKILLNKAGWKMGSDGYRHKNGKTLQLVYATTAGNPWREATERLVQYWFQQIGVKMVIHDYPANVYFGTVLPSGKGWDLGEFEWTEGYDPAASEEQLYETNAAQNFGKYSNPQVDKLLKEQDTMLNQSARQTVLRQEQAILHQDLPALWYYTPDEIDAAINLTGYQPDPWYVETWNCYDWQLTQ